MVGYGQLRKQLCRFVTEQGLQEHLLELKRVLTRVNKDLEVYEEYFDQISRDAELRADYRSLIEQRESLRRLIKKEKKNIFDIKNILINCLLTSTSLEIFEYRVFNYRLCRIRSHNIKKVLLEIRINYNKKMIEHNNRIIKLKLDLEKYKTMNAFTVLEVDCSLPDTNFSLVDEDSIARSDLGYSIPEKKRKRVILDNSNLRPNLHYVDIKPIIERNKYLAQRLRTVIVQLREACGRTTYAEIIKAILFEDMMRFNQEIAVPQMDSAGAHGTQEISQVSAGNVTLTETSESIPEQCNVKAMEWVKLTTSDIIDSYEKMTDRWLYVFNEVWDKNMTGLVKQYQLPKDMIIGVDLNACDLPNTIPFLVHRYWKGDMEIKIQVNSNKFQIGQLQASWYYDHHLDAKFALRSDKYINSQAHHVLINAGSSNEVTLKVPFVHHFPLLSTKKRADLVDVLNLGTLLVRVLNPLTMPDGGPQSANFSVFIRFTKSEFTGQIAGNIAVPQMDVAAKMAMGALNSLTAPNMDNPPQVRAPMYVVPTASHSWAAGTGIVEPLHSLRLDAYGQTVHQFTENELTVENIAGKYGLVKTIEWSKNTGFDTVLDSFDASPLLELYHYNKYDGQKHELASYAIPPVGVVSSLYNYWRGSIKFRFDIVASQFHTGRLIVGYVPGATSDDAITVKHLRAGPHMTFTLQTDQQFEYEIPFIADRPFWPRKYSGNFKQEQHIAPSRLYLGVINPLIPMESVAPHVYINVYMCAGSDFEVAVPIQPCLGLAYNKTVLYQASEVITAIPGYFPYYVGTWHTTGEYAIFRYGPGSDHVAQFDPKFENKQIKNVIGYYYKIEDLTDAPKYKKKDGSTVVVNYMVTAKIDGYVYGFPVESEKYAQAFVRQYVNVSFETAKVYLLKDLNEGQSDYTKGNPTWLPQEMSTKPIRIEDSFCELAMPQGEREDSKNTINAPSQLIRTRHGEALFGENFGNLKDVMRRYQFYCRLDVDSKKMLQEGQCSYIVPILPQGLQLNIGSSNSVNELGNRLRDGIIPIVSSGFRFYRGGLRIRIVMPALSGLTCWVQHRPDRKLQKLSQSQCTTVSTGEAMLNHGYATYVQDATVNSIIELEIPYYQNAALGLLQTPRILETSESMCYSLGNLNIGFSYKQVKATISPFTVSIYYALADDMNYTQFQGFPPMVCLDDIGDAVPQSALWERIKGKLTNDVKDAVKEEITTFVSEMKSVNKEEVDLFSFSKMFDSHILRNLMTNLAHVAANFNIKSIAIAICSILVEIGIITSGIVNKASELIQRFLIVFDSRLCDSGTKPTPTTESVEVAEEVAEEIHYQSEMTARDEAITGFISILWCGISAIFACKGKNFASCEDWKKLMLVDLSNVTRSSAFVFTFLRNILSVLDSMKLYLFGIVSPTFKFANVLSKLTPEMKAWAHMVVELENPLKFEEKRFERAYQMDVEFCYLKGIYFHHKAMDDPQNEVSKAILTIYGKILKLHEKLVKYGTDAYVRREPFGLWQNGPSGVGKSTLSTSLCIKLLKDSGVTCNVPPVFVHNPASEFWDACIQNPIMMVDDMFAVQSGELYDRQLQLLFSVVSPVVLVPPKASLEDKGKAYNPEILMINSNYDFFRFNGVHMDAVHRRRDILFKTQLTREKKPGCEHCIKGLSPKDASYAELADYHHLEFHIARSVIDPNTSYDGPYTYPEFYERVLEKFREVRQKNIAMYQRKTLENFSILSTMMENDPSVTLDRLITEYTKLQENRAEQNRESSIRGYLAAKGHTLKELSGDTYKTLLDKFNIFKDYIKYQNGEPIPKNHLYCFTEAEKVLGDIITDAQQRPQYRCGKLGYAAYITELIYQMADYYDDDLSQYKGILLEMMNEEVWTQKSSHLDLLYNKDIFKGMYDANELLNANVEIVEVQKTDGTKGKKISKHLPYQKCVHLTHGYSTMYLGEGNIYSTIGEKFYPSGIFDFSQRCSGTFCIMDLSYLKHVYLRTILDMNPLIKLMVQRPSHQKHLRHKLPACFWRQSTILDDEDKVMSVLDKIKDSAISYYVKHKPALDKLIKVMKTLWKWLKLALPYLIILGSGTAAYYNAKGLIDNACAMKSAFQSTPYSSFKTAGTSNPKFTVPTAQSNTQQSEAVVSMILHNMFQITGMSNDKILKCSGLVLKGRKLLILTHYLEEFNCYKDISFYGMFPYRNKSNETIKYGTRFALDDCEIKKYEIKTKSGVAKSNYIILDLPKVFQESKDITKFIATEKTHKSVQSEGLIVHNNGKLLTEVCIRVEDSSPTVIQSDGVTSVVSLNKVYTYGYQARGMCGSILLSTNLQRPIVGMHVAGVEIGNVRGISEPLIYEMFAELPEEKILLPDIETISPPLEVDAVLYPFKRIAKEYTNYQASKTQIEPSLIAGVFPVTTEPAPLSNDDPRLPKGTSPLFSGISCLGRPPMDFEKELLHEAKLDFRNTILENVIPIRAKVGLYSEQDVICGNIDTEGCRAMEFTTSPGFPLKFMKDNPGNSGKKWLFNLEETKAGYKLQSMNVKLQAILDTEHKMRLKGIRPVTIFVDSLKDSTISAEKCKIPGKTRIFSISPVQFTIRFRQYFEEFMLSYRKARLAAEHAIGIDCDSNEWSSLAARLTKFGDNIACGDYKNFGPGLMKLAAEAAFEIINAWYAHHGNERDNGYRTIMAKEIIESIHLVNNMIYSTPAGIPSGSPITTELNSMVNSLYIRCAWLKIIQKPLSYMHKTVSIVTYGDDVCLGLADEIKEDFNTEALSKFFGQYSIVFTDIDKSNNIVKYRKLFDASFLKRKFVQHPIRPTKFLAPIEIDSIWSCVNWTNKKLNKREAIIQNCEAAQVLAYGHGPDKFLEITDQLIKAMAFKKLQFRAKTWLDLDRQFFSVT